jgi:hypothetical protein
MEDSAKVELKVMFNADGNSVTQLLSKLEAMPSN